MQLLVGKLCGIYKLVSSTTLLGCIGTIALHVMDVAHSVLIAIPEAVIGSDFTVMYTGMFGMKITIIRIELSLNSCYYDHETSCLSILIHCTGD